MLEICKRHTNTMNGRIKLGLCVTVIFIVAMIFGLLVMAKPYAVYANGEKVSEPWVVKVDGQEVVVVESKEAGEAVVAGVTAEYVSGVEKQQETTIGNNVAVEKYRFDDSSTHPVVMSAGDAVDYIVELNNSDRYTPVAVEDTEMVEEQVEIPFKTETVETDDLYKGETKVHKEGKEGSKTVVSEVTMVNGKAVAKETVSTTVDKAPVTKVVYKGTKKRPVARSSNNGSPSNNNNTSYAGSSSGSYGSSSGSSYSYYVPSSGNGSSVAGFATQFVGNPYVSGGTSLTNGADCSGFTQSVYAKFGVSLPRTAAAQGGCGVAVPASQAKAGDLVCYGFHVGIYLGGGQMVHASTPSGGIKIGTVDWAAHSFRRVI